MSGCRIKILKCGGASCHVCQTLRGQDQDSQVISRSICDFWSKWIIYLTRTWLCGPRNILTESNGKARTPDYGRTARLKPGVINHAHHPYQTKNYHPWRGWRHPSHRIDLFNRRRLVDSSLSGQSRVAAATMVCGHIYQCMYSTYIHCPSVNRLAIVPYFDSIQICRLGMEEEQENVGV